MTGYVVMIVEGGDGLRSIDFLIFKMFHIKNTFITEFFETTLYCC